MPVPVPYAVTQLTWSGNWVAGTGPSGGDDPTTATDSLNLTPAAITQNGGLVRFPEQTLRIGKWQVSVTAAGDGTQLLSTACTQEVFADKTSTPKFTVGNQGCVCHFGCSNP